jgi:hypothetical protein
VSIPPEEGAFIQLTFQTLLDDCADAYIALAKNTSITGQQIVVGKFRISAILCCRCDGIRDPMLTL